MRRKEGGEVDEVRKKVRMIDGGEEQERAESERSWRRNSLVAVRVLVASKVWPGLQLTLSEEGEELGDLLQGPRGQGREGGGGESRK